MSTTRVAVVVGGGSGIGAGAARKLKENGFEVAILSSSGKGEALANDLGGLGITGTNRSSEDLQRLVDATIERFGRIDALVNSAGHGPRAGVLDLSDADWIAGMETYFLNVVRATRIVAPIMCAAGGGSIVNISSFATFEPDPAFPTSSVFRAGLAAYTKLFADANAAAHVRMNNVLAGFVDSFPVNEARVAAIPMGRYGKVSEIADLVAFLASDTSCYITGQNIRIDGGITRSL